MGSIFFRFSIFLTNMLMKPHIKDCHHSWVKFRYRVVRWIGYKGLITGSVEEAITRKTKTLGKQPFMLITTISLCFEFGLMSSNSLEWQKRKCDAKVGRKRSIVWLVGLGSRILSFGKRYASCYYFGLGVFLGCFLQVTCYII